MQLCVARPRWTPPRRLPASLPAATRAAKRRSGSRADGRVAVRRARGGGAHRQGDEPDKVFFRTRGETKLDLVRYFLSVGDGIVRALHERPTQLKRHPDGAEGEAIYQKRVPKHRPDWIETATVTFPSGAPPTSCA